MASRGGVAWTPTIIPAESGRLATLEHELRTPLAVIRAIAEILRDGADLPRAEQEALLDALLVEQARLGRTLEALLDELSGA